MNDSAIWERGQHLPIRALALVRATTLQPVGMQDPVHLISAIRTSYSDCPGGLESLIVGMPTLGAGPVASSKRCRFVEEEEFRPRVGLQQLAMAAAKRRAAGDPAPQLPGADDAPRVVVQDAPIAHERAALGNGHDLAKGCYSILERHGYLPER
jgi:hypothetical protein